MASTFSSLFKDTMIYGMSSMLGRFLNWLLTFLYVRVLVPEEFGQMTNLYAWAALLLIVLTYGMETSFFRFASRHDQPNLVFSTGLISFGGTSLLFLLFGTLFLGPLSVYLGYFEHPILLLMLWGVIASDAFLSLPLAYLRYAQRPFLFMMVRLGFVLLTIILSVFVFLALPALEQAFPSVFLGWYRSDWSLYYILGINLLGNIVQGIVLMRAMPRNGWGFDVRLLKKMLSYGWPILLLGLVGSFNNQADKILFPMQFADRAQGDMQLGIYSACYKLAVIMVLFTQAFRYAYDPFVFSKSRESEEEAKGVYAESMKYYLLFALFIYLGVMSSLGVLQYLLQPEYLDGLGVVPWIMAGQLMFGLYFNLSLWYKLTDRTYWGAILSIVGCALTVAIIVFGAETYGYMVCAWASVISNAVILLCSYVLGQRYYPVDYPLGRMGGYVVLTIVLLICQKLFAAHFCSSLVVQLIFNYTSCLVFVSVVLYFEVPRGMMQSALMRIPPLKKLMSSSVGGGSTKSEN